MCPKCGNQGSILQSVTSDTWRCEVDIGGCGATFDSPPSAVQCHLENDKVESAIQAMTDAIRRFERQDCRLGQPSLLDMEHRTAELLEILKNELGRLGTLVGDPA